MLVSSVLTFGRAKMMKGRPAESDRGWIEDYGEASEPGHRGEGLFVWSKGGPGLVDGQWGRSGSSLDRCACAEFWASAIKGEVGYRMKIARAAGGCNKDFCFLRW